MDTCEVCEDEASEFMITCPFCGEADFDLIGLKIHLTREGWCPEFEALRSDHVH